MAERSRRVGRAARAPSSRQVCGPRWIDWAIAAGNDSGSGAGVEEKRLRDEGTDAARTEQPSQGGEQVDRKNGQIAHRRMVAGWRILRNLGQNSNSPATGRTSRKGDQCLIRICACWKMQSAKSLNFWMRSFSSVGLHAGYRLSVGIHSTYRWFQSENSSLNLWLALQDGIKQRVPNCGERIGHGNAVPCKPVLHVLRKEQTASCIGCSCQNHCVPNTQLMLRC